VALLHAGRLLAVDTPAALSAAYPHPLLEVRLPDARSWRDRLSALPGVESVQLFGDRLHVAVTSLADARPGLRAALAHGTDAVAPVLEPIAATLEDVFLERLAHQEATA